ncbi:MAG: cupredoxin domain-containing protein [Thermoplasmatota archaeon]
MRALLFAVMGVILAGCVSYETPSRDELGRYVIHMETIDRFLPGNASVPPGATVVWENDAPAQPAGFRCPVPGQPRSPLCHDVAVEQGDTVLGTSWNETRKNYFVAPGESWAFTFTTAGVYQVYCHTHHELGMVSTVRVG